MGFIEGPLWVAAALLLAAGARKVAAPTATATALRAARLWGHPLLVRCLGAGEVAVALLVFARGGRLAAGLLAGAYVAFAGFLVRLRRVAGADAACGCLGTQRARVSALHIAVNLLFAAWAAAAVAVPPGPAAEVLGAQPWGGAPAVALVLLATALVRLLFTALPDLLAATREAATTEA